MLSKLLVDFGLVILIWMTQLVVYPSFTYFNADDLLRWHSKYTAAISVIVMPLMVLQVGLHGWGLLNGFSVLKLVASVLIIIIWINTFFYAVPLHNKIGANQEIMESAKNLVHVNWFRTALWSLVFLVSLLDSVRN